jgi:hypothetical protein
MTFTTPTRSYGNQCDDRTHLGDDAREAGLLESLDELLLRHLSRGYPRHVVAQIRGAQHARVEVVPVLLPLAAADGELRARRALRVSNSLLASLQRRQLRVLLIIGGVLLLLRVVVAAAAVRG